MLLCEPMDHVIVPKMSYNVVIPEVVIGNPFFLRELGYPPESTLVKTGAGMTEKSIKTSL